MTDTYSGVKIALCVGDALVSILRDNTPGLSYANQWELPGGGREQHESPLECLRRELREELTIELDATSIVWHKPFYTTPDDIVYFMVAHAPPTIISQIQLGSEGQAWELIPFRQFLAGHDIVDIHQAMLRDYLLSTGRLGPIQVGS
jgi:8-oxo-dGTP diphosphatase